MVLASPFYGGTFGYFFAPALSFATGRSLWLWLGLALAVTAWAHAAASRMLSERRRKAWLAQLPTYHVDTRETVNGVPKTVSDELCVASAMVSRASMTFPIFILQVSSIHGAAAGLSQLHSFLYPDSPLVGWAIHVYFCLPFFLGIG